MSAGGPSALPAQGWSSPQLSYEAKVVVCAVVSVLAALLYSAVVGVRNLWWLVAASLLAGASIGLTSWRRRRRHVAHGELSPEPLVELTALTVGAVTVAVFAAFIVDGPVAPLGLLLALHLIPSGYVLPGRWRVPSQVALSVIWGLGLWFSADGSQAVGLAHVAGGIMAGLVVNETADRQTALREAEQTSRRCAEALARLLVGVQQVNDLEPQAVLDAVAQGLIDLGFSVVEIRRFEEERGISRLVSSAIGADGMPPPEEVALDVPLLQEMRRRWEPIFIEAYQDDPRPVLKAAGYDAAVMVPLTLADGARASLAAAVMAPALTPLQREAVELLTDHAVKALERAGRYASDARIAEDLRRLDARTQDFVSTASHELRTPLTVISGLGQTLRRRWSALDSERRADILQRIDANAERLATMVRHLLDASAFDRGDMRPTLERLRLRASVRRLLDRLATVTAAYPVELHIPEELEVEVDAALLEHVLENLLTNVVRHTPQGTRVVVSAEERAGRVRITVADEGPGIEPGDLPRVLDRFYRGGDPDRRPSGGLGLGLALSQQIVRAHGGELTVTSRPGEGTSFSFTVPCG